MTDPAPLPTAQLRPNPPASSRIRTALSRPVLAVGVLTGAVVLGRGGIVSAQGPRVQLPSMERVHATQPVENSVTWAADNCAYQFSRGAWRQLDTCRIMRSSTVYDVYRRSTRALTARFDETERGWIAAILLNSPAAVWIKFATNGSGRVLALVNTSGKT